MDTNCDPAGIKPHVEVRAAAVGKHQKESILSPRAQEQGDGEVLTQIFGDGEGRIAVKVLMPKANSNMLCKTRGSQYFGLADNISMILS